MTTTDQPIIRPSGLPLSVPGQLQELTNWSAYGPCDTLTPIIDDLRPAPGCGAAAGAPCIVRNTTRERPHPHTGRRPGRTCGTSASTTSARSAAW